MKPASRIGLPGWIGNRAGLDQLDPPRRRSVSCGDLFWLGARGPPKSHLWASTGSSPADRCVPSPDPWPVWAGSRSTSAAARKPASQPRREPGTPWSRFIRKAACTWEAATRARSRADPGLLVRFDWWPWPSDPMPSSGSSTRPCNTLTSRRARVGGPEARQVPRRAAA